MYDYDIDELLDRWYDNIISLCDNGCYLCFSSLQSYNLFKIVDGWKGNKISKINCITLTKDSLLNYSEEFVKFYIKFGIGFKHLILVTNFLFTECHEDILIESFENDLLYYFKKNGVDFDKIMLKVELQKIIKVVAPACWAREDHLAWYTMYQPIHPGSRSLRAYFYTLSRLLFTKEPTKFDNNFSYTASKEEVEEIKSKYNFETISHDTEKEDFFIQLHSIENNSNVNNILTCRIAKVKNKEEYNMSSFLILPSLSREEYKRLKDELNNRLKKKNYKNVPSNFFEEKDNNLRNMCTIFQRINFVLSYAIIYNMIGNLKDNNKYEEEIDRLSAIYNFPDADIKEVLKELTHNPLVENINELKGILNNSLSPKNILSSYNQSSYTKDSTLREWTENLAYNSCYSQNVDRYECRVIIPRSNGVASKNRARPLKSIVSINDAINILTKNLSENDFKKIISYFLFLVDKSMFVCETYPYTDNNVEDGVKQYIRGGEEVMEIYPIRMAKYLNLLWYIDDFTYGLRSISNKDFFIQFYKSGLSSVSSEEYQKIIQFYDVLSSYGDRPTNWVFIGMNSNSKYIDEKEDDDIKTYRKELKAYASRDPYYRHKME